MSGTPCPGPRRAVLFDLFHTLVDVGRVPGPYTADILGVSRDQWRAACFTDRHDIRNRTDQRTVVQRLARTIDPSISARLIDQAAAVRQQRFEQALRDVDTGTLEQLQRLRAGGLKLGLVSNASTGEVSGWSDSPLRELFDTAIFSCDCGHAKPEPEIYRLALESLDVDAGEALFVGDGGSREHRGAAAIGLYPIMLTRFLAPNAVDDPERRHGAALVLGELEQLTRLLDVA